MAKRKKHGRHPKGGRTTPKGTRPGQTPSHQPSRPAHFDTPLDGGPHLPPPSDDEPDLFVSIRTSLRDNNPLGVFGLASSLIELFDPRHDNPFAPTKPERPPEMESLAQMVDTFIAVETQETSALLATIAELCDDELLSTRIRREIRRRQHPLPRWLHDMADIEIGRTVEMAHVLGDGDNIFIEATLPGNLPLTATVYVDHNAGTLVKDAFIIPDNFERVEEIHRSMMAGGQEDTIWRELDPADARAMVRGAIDTHARTVPPYESESWPGCRPVVEWLISHLPDGGQGYELTEWSDDELSTIATRFLTSAHGADFDDDEHRDLLDSLLWFGSGYGPGDPLRWSGVRVEIFLMDWVPRKIAATPDHLSMFPALLRAFIRFSHDERGIRAALTGETTDAVDYWEPEYLDTIGTARLQGPAAILAAAGAVDPEDADWGLFEPWSYEESHLDWLASQVGGRDALDALDDTPQPDEAFRWDGVPDDVQATVGEILARTDHCCDELLDVEHRTATRRLLFAAATGDPRVFRRRARVDNTAAAICWLVGRANGTVGNEGDASIYVKDIMVYFGVTGTPSQRATTLAVAAGVDPESLRYGRPYLESPRYLVARTRRRLIQARDRTIARGE